MRLIVAVVGKPRNAGLAAAIGEYETRAARYWPLEVREVREERGKAGDSSGVMKREGERLTDGIGGARIIACDERGKGMTSREFAQWLSAERDRAVDIALLIGGAFGLSDEVRHRSALSLSLAPWTLSHEVATIARIVGGEEIRRTLDLACGAGRHARHMAARWFTVGLDLSQILLRLARREGSPAAFVRGDMRLLPFREDAFDLVANFFTSFGYFNDDAEHRLVVREVARVTRRGGFFVLDYLNAERLRRTLVPYDERRVGDSIVEQRREISADGRSVIKTITVRGDGRRFVERVRLFTPAELIALVAAEGFETQSMLGDYAGAELSPDSPRAVVVARRR